MCGYFSSNTIVFGTYTLSNAGASDIYVVKYDQIGNVIWAKQIGGAGDDYIGYLSIDNSGNLFVSGIFTSATLVFGATTLFNNGMDDIFISKYDTLGNLIWVKQEGGNDREMVTGICSDSNGNLFLTGIFKSSSLNISSTTLTNHGEFDILIAKYDANGNSIWAKNEGGTDSDYTNGICVDLNGNITVVGTFYYVDISIDSITLTNSGAYNILIANFENNGQVNWAKSIGGSGQESANSVITDQAGNIYVTGWFNSAISFDSIQHSNQGDGDIFISKSDANGNFIWSKKIGGNSMDVANSLAIDIDNNIYIGGYFKSNSIIYANDTIVNDGVNDILLTKLDNNGIPFWITDIGGTASEVCNSISLNLNGSICITGNFSSPSINFGGILLNNLGLSDAFITNIGSITGLEKDIESKSYSIFPNPCMQQITIALSDKAKSSSIKIVDAMGREVKNVVTREMNRIAIEIDFAPGIYFVNIFTDKGLESIEKLIVH